MAGSSPVDPSASEPFGDAPLDLVGGAALRQIEVPPVQLHDRAIGHRLAVGRARRLQLQGAGCVQAAQELVEQARLADARLAGDQRRCLPARRSPAGIRSASRSTLGRAPTSGVSPRSRETSSLVRPRISPVTRVGADRLALALDLEVAEILEDEEALARAPGCDG